MWLTGFRELWKQSCFKHTIEGLAFGVNCDSSNTLHSTAVFEEPNSRPAVLSIQGASKTPCLIQMNLDVKPMTNRRKSNDTVSRGLSRTVKL